MTDTPAVPAGVTMRVEIALSFLVLECRAFLTSVRTASLCTALPLQAVLDVPIYGHVSALQSFRPRVGVGPGWVSEGRW